MNTGGQWPGVDPRFRVEPRRIIGPFYAVRIVDELRNVEVFVTGGSFLTGSGRGRG